MHHIRPNGGGAPRVPLTAPRVREHESAGSCCRRQARRRRMVFPTTTVVACPPCEVSIGGKQHWFLQSRHDEVDNRSPFRTVDGTNGSYGLGNGPTPRRRSHGAASAVGRSQKARHPQRAVRGWANADMEVVVSHAAGDDRSIGALRPSCPKSGSFVAIVVERYVGQRVGPLCRATDVHPRAAGGHVGNGRVDGKKLMRFAPFEDQGRIAKRSSGAHIAATSDRPR